MKAVARPQCWYV